LLLGNRLLLIFGVKYAENGTGLLYVLAGSVFPVAANAFYITIMRINKTLKATILLTLLIALATLVLSLVFVPRFGIIGAGFGWLAAQTLACVYTMPKLIQILRLRQDDLIPVSILPGTGEEK
jgi:O-antigen/teichoic acid export membrane protein